MDISSEQVRAARALLRWEQKDLAEAAQISLPSVKRLEGQEGMLSSELRSAIAVKQALEANGIRFAWEFEELSVALNVEKRLKAKVDSLRNNIFPDVVEWSTPSSSGLIRPDLVGFGRDRKPIVVEVKRCLRSEKEFRGAVTQLKEYAVQYGASTAVLISQSVPDTLREVGDLEILSRNTLFLSRERVEVLVFSLCANTMTNEPAAPHSA
ncbi:hypothetical protein [Methylobacterium nigriterrae]|uniref:hypothetical protein n=1 Tax=Methylobacterium nigriterrae TaxID=3127512 RepID=UPI00301371EB